MEETMGTYFRWIICLALAMVLVACENRIIQPARDGRVSQVRFDLSKIYQVPGLSQQSAASVIDSLALTVSQFDGTTQQFHQRVSLQDSTVLFDIALAPGNYDFQAEVFSNNGALLYTGTANQEIEEDGFQVDIQLRAVNSVMVVFPDSIDMVNNYQQMLFFINKGRVGIDTLFWKIISYTPPLDSCVEGCFYPSDTTGFVIAGSLDSISVFQTYIDQNAPEKIIMRIDSEVGYVDIKIRTNPGK